MGGVSVDGSEGKLIESAMEMLVPFTGETGPKLGEWERRLKADPGELDQLEHEVRNEYQRGAGLMMAGLISVVMQSPELARAAERTRTEYSTPPTKGRERTFRLRDAGRSDDLGHIAVLRAETGTFRQSGSGCGCRA